VQDATRNLNERRNHTQNEKRAAEQVCLAVTLWPCIREALHSNPDRDTTYLEVLVFSSTVLSNVFIYWDASDSWLWRRGRRVAIAIIIIIIIIIW
jgi:hypothetical protein